MFHFTNHPTRRHGSDETSESAATSAAEAAYDAQLVERFNAGDESAFAEIMSRYHPRVLNLARRCLNNDNDAEDIAQDTFIRAHRGLSRFRGDSALSTWLCRIAVNLARNRYWYFFRRHRHSTFSINQPVTDQNVASFSDLVAADTPSPHRLAMQNEFIELVGHCVEHLEEPHRDILRMRYLLHYSYEEIGDRLRINLGTVKSRVARARDKLRQAILRSAPEFGEEARMDDFFEANRDAGVSATPA